MHMIFVINMTFGLVRGQCGLEESVSCSLALWNNISSQETDRKENQTEKRMSVVQACVECRTSSSVNHISPQYVSACDCVAQSNCTEGCLHVHIKEKMEAKCVLFLGP